MPKIASQKKVKKRALGRKRRVRREKEKTEEKPSRRERKTRIEKYIEAVGRRKTASARVRIFQQSKDKTFFVNKKEVNYYFPNFELQKIIFSPLNKTNLENKFKIEVSVKGGGRRGQAEAVRLGIARALVQIDEKLRGNLKSLGYLTRDPREKERKKFGLKGARRAPQWHKR